MSRIGTDDERRVATSIAEACESAANPGIFCIGSFGKFVNFSAQQYRALNFAWALDLLGRIPKTKPVAIIGGGLTGVTAAAAFVHLGYQVELFESQKELMAHQFTTDHRLVHPSINGWPSVPLHPNTDLPFLNWVSGPCSKVIAGVLSEIEKLCRLNPDVLRIHRNWRIVDVSRGLNGFLLRKARAPIDIDTAFGSVIFAIGFGDERHHPHFKALSYWYPDGVEREALIGEVENFIVSGCGDGGLIDALRILHRDFDKGGLIFETAYQLEGSPIAGELKQAEDDNLSPQLLQDAYAKAARQIIDDARYSDLKATLEASIGHCRPRLILSARIGENPFVSRAAPIHKLLLAHAMVSNKVVYIRAEMSKDGTNVALGNKRFPDSPKTMVVVRHGPLGPAFGGLLESDELAALKEAQLRIEREFTRQAWTGHFPDTSPEPILVRAERMHRQSLRAVRLLSPNAIVTVAPHGYTVIVGNDSDKAKIPTELFGLAVKTTTLPEI